MTGDLKALVACLKAAGHPLRLRVLGLAADAEYCVCQLAEILRQPQSSVSEAVRELRGTGLLQERKSGRWVFISVPPPAEAPALLPSLLVALEALPEIQEDRTRGLEIRKLALPLACTANGVDRG
nr:metalloregulator ArsR/SmtB family transcription factor [uncultured Holophaga sp.]